MASNPTHEPARIKLASGMTSAADAEILKTIALAGIAMAVWQPAPNPRQSAWLERLAPQHLPSLQTVSPADAVESRILAACVAAAPPAGAECALFAADVAKVARIFAEVTAQPFLRLSLDGMRGTAPHKFHLDLGRARLVCTYRGRGMQFGAARPSGPPDQIHELAPGAVAIFRGLLWPAPEFPGVVHRAPPLADGDDAGLTLVIEPLDATAGNC